MDAEGRDSVCASAGAGGEWVIHGDQAAGDRNILGQVGIEEKGGQVGGRAGRQAVGNAEAEAASFRFEDAGVGHPGVVALDDDVHAVLKGESDGVLQAEVHLAGLDQLFEARRINERTRIDVPGAVGRRDIWPQVWRVRVVKFVQAE